MNTQWKFYRNTNEAWEAMLIACKQAKKNILLEQYLFNNDSIGQKFAEVLIAKAREGVSIKIILDMAGSYFLYKSDTEKAMTSVGIEIRYWNIVKPWRIRKFFSWYFRDHRKILIVDNTTGFTGGVGIDGKMTGWRDTLVEIKGEIVSEMINTWKEMWELTLEKNPLARFIATRHYSETFEFITNAPYFGKRFLYHTLMNATRKAKNSIIITTPYFVPDNRLLRLLIKKAKNGVKVQIILPKNNDVFIVGIASHTYYDILLRSGIEIYHYSPTTLHAKSVVIDDLWATLGSLNMDNMSFVYNHEANIVSSEPAFVETLKKDALKDIQDSDTVSLDDWRKRSFIKKIRELFIFPVRKFL